MPASDRPDTETVPAPPETGVRREGLPDPEAALEALAGALDLLLSAYGDLRDRADQAEAERRGLAEALQGADLEGMDSSQVAVRLKEMADENRILRDVIEESHERARRIRSRLILMEDEA